MALGLNGLSPVVMLADGGGGGAMRRTITPASASLSIKKQIKESVQKRGPSEAELRRIQREAEEQGKREMQKWLARQAYLELQKKHDQPPTDVDQVISKIEALLIDDANTCITNYVNALKTKYESEIADAKERLLELNTDLLIAIACLEYYNQQLEENLKQTAIAWQRDEKLRTNQNYITFLYNQIPLIHEMYPDIFDDTDSGEWDSEHHYPEFDDFYNQCILNDEENLMLNIQTIQEQEDIYNFINQYKDLLNNRYHIRWYRKNTEYDGTTDTYAGPGWELLNDMPRPGGSEVESTTLGLQTGEKQTLTEIGSTWQPLLEIKNINRGAYKALYDGNSDEAKAARRLEASVIHYFWRAGVRLPRHAEAWNYAIDQYAKDVNAILSTSSDGTKTYFDHTTLLTLMSRDNYNPLNEANDFCMHSVFAAPLYCPSSHGYFYGIVDFERWMTYEQEYYEYQIDLLQQEIANDESFEEERQAARDAMTQLQSEHAQYVEQGQQYLALMAQLSSTVTITCQFGTETISFYRDEETAETQLQPIEYNGTRWVFINQSQFPIDTSVQAGQFYRIPPAALSGSTNENYILDLGAAQQITLYNLPTYNLFVSTDIIANQYPYWYNTTNNYVLTNNNNKDWVLLATPAKVNDHSENAEIYTQDIIITPTLEMVEVPIMIPELYVLDIPDEIFTLKDVLLNSKKATQTFKVVATYDKSYITSNEITFTNQSATYLAEQLSDMNQKFKLQLVRPIYNNLNEGVPETNQFGGSHVADDSISEFFVFDERGHVVDNPDGIQYDSVTYYAILTMRTDFDDDADYTILRYSQPARAATQEESRYATLLTSWWQYQQDHSTEQTDPLKSGYLSDTDKATIAAYLGYNYFNEIEDYNQACEDIVSAVRAQIDDDQTVNYAIDWDMEVSGRDNDINASSMFKYIHRMTTAQVNDRFGLGIPETDTVFALEFRIKNSYSLSNSRPIDKLQLNVLYNGITYNVEREFHFGSASTMGSNYNISIMLRNHKTQATNAPILKLDRTNLISATTGSDEPSAIGRLEYDLIANIKHKNGAALSEEERLKTQVYWYLNSGLDNNETESYQYYINSSGALVLSIKDQSFWDNDTYVVPPIITLRVDGLESYSIFCSYPLQTWKATSYDTITAQNYEVSIPNRVVFNSTGTTPDYDKSAFEVLDGEDNTPIQNTNWELFMRYRLYDTTYTNALQEVVGQVQSPIGTNYFINLTNATYEGYLESNSWLTLKHIVPAEEVDVEFPSMSLGESWSLKFVDDANTEWQDKLADAHTFLACKLPDGSWITQAIVFEHAVYCSSLVNSWEGSELVLDSENNTVMTKRLVVGSKDNNNTFTGMMMGDWNGKDNDGSIDTPGLYGFKAGAQTYGLLTTGEAFFGAAGKGRIYINKQAGLISNASLTAYLNLNPRKEDRISDDTYNIREKGYSPYFLYCESEQEIQAGPNTDWRDLVKISETKDVFAVDPHRGIFMSGGIRANWGNIGGWEISDTGLTKKKNSSKIYLGAGNEDPLNYDDYLYIYLFNKCFYETSNSQLSGCYDTNLLNHFQVQPGTTYIQLLRLQFEKILRTFLVEPDATNPELLIPIEYTPGWRPIWWDELFTSRDILHDVTTEIWGVPQDERDNNTEYTINTITDLDPCLYINKLIKVDSKIYTDGYITTYEYYWLYGSNTAADSTIQLNELSRYKTQIKQLYNSYSFGTTDDGAYYIWAGPATLPMIPQNRGVFSITYNGDLYAESGTIGGWSLTDSKLYSSKSNNVYVKDEEGRYLKTSDGAYVVAHNTADSFLIELDNGTWNGQKYPFISVLNRSITLESAATGANIFARMGFYYDENIKYNTRMRRRVDGAELRKIVNFNQLEDWEIDYLPKITTKEDLSETNVNEYDRVVTVPTIADLNSDNNNDLAAIYQYVDNNNNLQTTYKKVWSNGGPKYLDAGGYNIVIDGVNGVINLGQCITYDPRTVIQDANSEILDTQYHIVRDKHSGAILYDYDNPVYAPAIILDGKHGLISLYNGNVILSGADNRVEIGANKDYDGNTVGTIQLVGFYVKSTGYNRDSQYYDGTTVDHQPGENEQDLGTEIALSLDIDPNVAGTPNWTPAWFADLTDEQKTALNLEQYGTYIPVGTASISVEIKKAKDLVPKTAYIRGNSISFVDEDGVGFSAIAGKTYANENATTADGTEIVLTPSVNLESNANTYGLLSKWNLAAGWIAAAQTIYAAMECYGPDGVYASLNYVNQKLADLASQINGLMGRMNGSNANLSRIIAAIAGDDGGIDQILAGFGGFGAGLSGANGGATNLKQWCENTAQALTTANQNYKKASDDLKTYQDQTKAAMEQAARNNQQALDAAVAGLQASIDAVAASIPAACSCSKD